MKSGIIESLPWKFFGRSVLHFIASYLCIVVFFGILYYTQWMCSHDSFIFNSEINSRPFSSSAFTEPEVPDYSKIDLDKLNEIVEAHKLQAHTISLQITAVEYSLSIIEAAYAELAKKDQKLTNVNLENAIKSEVGQYIETRKIKQIVLDGLPKNPDSIQDLIIANLALEIAELNLKIAEGRVKIYRQMLSDGKYRDPEIVSLLKLNNDKRNKAHQAISQLHKELINLRSKTYRNLQLALNARAGKLGLIDFIYFSAITATTTGYGDIIPNSIGVKITVIFEILFFLAAFGILTSVTASKVSKIMEGS